MPTTTSPLRVEMRVQPSEIRPGREFDTEFEQGCVVASTPDAQGKFDAYDSDEVLCSYSIQMVTVLS
jgi:hypothetical protein